MEVFGDADDGAVYSPHAVFLSQRCCGIAITQAARRSLIDDERLGRVGSKVMGEGPARGEVDFVTGEIIEIDYVEVEVDALQFAARVGDLQVRVTWRRTGLVSRKG